MSLNEAARACSQPEATVTVTLLEYLELWDSTTQAVFTRRIAQVYGMTPQQEEEITRDYVYDEKLGRIRLREGPPEVPRPKPAGIPKAKGAGPKRKGRRAPWRLDVSEVFRRLAAMGWSMREVSLMAGRGQDWLSDLIQNAELGRTVQTKTVRALAQVMDCDAALIAKEVKEEEHELLP